MKKSKEEFEQDLQGLRANTRKFLELRDQDLSFAELKQLAEALRGNTSLKLLKLSNNFSLEFAEGIREILKMATSNLQVTIAFLRIEDNKYSSVGMNAIAEGLAATHAQLVYLGGNNFDSAGADAISRGLAATRAQSITLSGNNFGSVGADAIGKALTATCVQSIDLRNNNFGSAGAGAIGKGLAATRVHSVDLSENNFGSAGADAIAKALAATRAHSVDLSGNNFDSAGADVMGRGLAATHARSVCLSENNFGSAGADAMGRGLAATRAQLVDLSYNHFGSAGAEAIGGGLAATRAQLVYLSENDFGSAGADVIGRGLAATRARSVDLGYNNFGPAGADAIVVEILKVQNDFLEEIIGMERAFCQRELAALLNRNRATHIVAESDAAIMSIIGAARQAVRSKEKKEEYLVERVMVNSIEVLLPEILDFTGRGLTISRVRAAKAFLKNALEGNYQEVQMALKRNAELKSMYPSMTSIINSLDESRNNALKIIINRLGHQEPKSIAAEKKKEEEQQNSCLRKDDLQIVQALLVGHQEPKNIAEVKEKKEEQQNLGLRKDDLQIVQVLLEAGINTAGLAELASRYGQVEIAAAIKKHREEINRHRKDF